MRPTAPGWQLLESILWTPTDGFYLLDRHLARLAGSAAAFGWPVDIPRVLTTCITAVRVAPDRRKSASY